MLETRKYSVYPSDLDILQSFIQLQDYFIECGYEEDTACCNNISYNLQLNEFRELHAENFTEFLEALQQYPDTRTIGIHSHWKSINDDGFMFNISITPSETEIQVKSSNPDIIADVHDRAQECFKASNPP
jgi:hypothetical protein